MTDKDFQEAKNIKAAIGLLNSIKTQIVGGEPISYSQVIRLRELYPNFGILIDAEVRELKKRFDKL